MDFGVVIERGGGAAAIERRTGIRTENIYAMKSGARNAGEDTAKRIAEHVPGVSAKEVIILNRGAVAKRAIRERDAAAALKAVTEAVKLSEGHTLNAEGEKYLDELVATVVKFAENPHLFDFEDEDDEEAEQYGDDPERDVLGRYVGKSRRDIDVEGDEDEDYGDDPNRDAFGRAITWAGKGHEEDEPEDDFEDEEYGDDPERDHFGRYIGKEAR